MVTATKITKFCILFFIFIFCLTPLTGILCAQDLKCEAGFSVRSDHGWSGWQEISKPSFGVGPRVQNNLGFIFINGGSESYQKNIEHLVFEQLNCDKFIPNFITAHFSFNNSLVGGRLFLDNGNITCLDQSSIGAFSSDELVIITLRDNGVY